MSDALIEMQREIDRMHDDLARFTSGQYATHEWIYASDPKWVGTANTPLTSTSWDGDAFSTVGTSTQLDLSAVFGVPANIKAVLLYCEMRDSGSAAGAAYFTCGPSATYYYAGVTRCGGLTNDISNSQTMVVPCDDNGDVWYRLLATGASTADIWLRVWGYMI